MRKNTFFLLLLLVGLHTSAFAQTTSPISGIIKDSASGKPLEKAVIALVEIGKTDTARVLTDAQGKFTINRIITGDFIIVASYVGYQTVGHRYPVTMVGELGDITLHPFIRSMQEIIIEAPPIVLKKDTVEYRADAFKVKDNAVVEDLLKKMPGITVNKDGSVTAHGKQVTKVKVNGKDFFGSDPKMATKNLPADMIDKVQVIDEQSDQAKFSGFDDGEREKVINLQLKKNRNQGVFARANAGVGTDGRYQASLTANSFKNNQQISLIGNANNINSNMFTFGSTNLSGGMGRMMKAGTNMMSNAGGMNAFANTSNNDDQGFLTAAGGNSNNNGITTANSIGLNYVDQWSPKINVYGSYVYGHGNTDMTQYSARQYFLADSVYYYTQDQRTKTIQQNHRLYFNVEYQIDTANSVKISPTFTYGKNRQNTINMFSSQDNKKITSSDGSQTYLADNTNPNLSGTVLLRHKFVKKGRTISVNFSLGTNSTDETDDNTSHTRYVSSALVDTVRQQYLINSHNTNDGVRVSYTEPIGRDKQIELNYQYNKAINKNNKLSYDIADSQKVYRADLSNEYKSDFVTRQAGINFRQSKKKYFYTVGLGFQPTTLNGRSQAKDSLALTAQRHLNYLPQASFNYSWNKMKTLTIRYTTRVNQPSISQLQPVPDLSNPLYVNYGNPDLKPEYYHTINANFLKFNLMSGKMFFAFLNANLVHNKVVNNTVVVSDSGQVNRPQNVNGYYNVNGVYVFSKPYKSRRYVLTYTGNIRYTNDVSLVQAGAGAGLEGSVKNTGRNWTVGQGGTLEYNYKWLELSTGANYNLNATSYTLDSIKGRTYDSWIFNQIATVTFLKTWNINYDFTYTINNGLSSGVGKNIYLMNIWLEKLLLKKAATIRLEVHDLFNSNTNIARNVTSSYIEDTRTNLLNRYFMLSFTWKFQKFKGKQKSVQFKESGIMMP